MKNSITKQSKSPSAGRASAPFIAALTHQNISTIGVKMKKIALCISMLSISAGISADTIWCTGKITNAYVSSSSGLFVKPDWGEWKRLCNLNGSHNGIETETCNSWLSMAQV